MGWGVGVLQALQGAAEPGPHASWVDGEPQCYWRAHAGSVRVQIDEKD